MNTNTVRGAKIEKIKDARLEIVASLYKKGYSFRKIAEEVKIRLGLEKNVSLNTIHSDVETLKKELRESRIGDMEFALNLELARIDDTVRELWSQWEKSKQDYSKKTETQKGSPKKANSEDKNAPDVIKTYQVEKTVQEVVQLGNVAYIAEIRAQLSERRKLIGLYAPERQELTGKDGKDLNPASVINWNNFTQEEKSELARLALKSDFTGE